MLTPQEVSERAFAKASFGGYNMAMVDEFLDLLTADYTTLYNENALLKSKMKVLVDKVEEYRATEDAMRKALMTAQRMADDLVREAEQKKLTMLQDAEREAGDKIAQIRQEIANEEYRLTAAQNATAAFVAKVTKLHQEEMTFLDGLSQLCPEPAPTQIRVEETAQAIEDSVQRILAAAQADVAAELEQQESEHTMEFAVDVKKEFELAEPEMEDEDEDEESDDLSKTAIHHIDFGSLEFGKDYEIK